MLAAGQLRVLVLEDDLLVGRAVSRTLRSHGAACEVFATCADAIATTTTFDVGVFDIDLPDGDGVDTARELVARGAVPFAVFFSGQVAPALVRRAREVGPFVHKGAGAGALVEAIGAGLLAHLSADALAAGDQSAPRTPRRRGRSGLRRKIPG